MILDECKITNSLTKLRPTQLFRVVPGGATDKPEADSSRRIQLLGKRSAAGIS